MPGSVSTTLNYVAPQKTLGRTPRILPERVCPRSPCDGPSQVVANCVVVLNEIMADAGGMATNGAIVHHLLGRLEDFNEWGVCHILVLVSRSVPPSTARGDEARAAGRRGPTRESWLPSVRLRRVVRLAWARGA